MPLRRGFWREYPAKIKEGVVLIPRDLPEGQDMSNAAQAVLISHIESRLMEKFRRPVLSRFGEFYAEFNRAYTDATSIQELRIWEEIGCEVDESLAEQPDRELTDKEAAYLTLVMWGHPKPPESMELYMFLPAYARVYEELLREKYGERYTPALFYKALREHMPKFILQIIGMDMVITFLLTMNLATGPIEDGFILKPSTVLDVRLMRLGENDALSLLPKFVDVIHERAREQNYKEDQNGRTADRGCPVLFASKRDEILSFAIEELIAQHELYYKA
ncbi:hypothetical protein K2Q08_03330 [Patescibacteria group bacterium]|nr:hypothetical protein [Patescibacteria group bacterium]